MSAVRIRRVHLGLFLTVTFWGASFIATKIVLRELNPAAIVFLRFSLGLIVLFLIVVSQKKMRCAPVRKVPAVLLLGFLGITFHQWLQVTGLKSATATNTSWIVATIPVFVALLGWLFLQERLNGWRIAGTILAAAGVLVVTSDAHPHALKPEGLTTVGERLILLSALNWAIFTVLSKRLFVHDPADQSKQEPLALNPIQWTLNTMAAGCVFNALWLVVDGGWRALPAMSPEGWLALGFLGVACSGLAYLFWYEALEVVDAAQAGVFLYIEPLVTVLLAGPLLGERFSEATALGGAAILTGVWLVNRR